MPDKAVELFSELKRWDDAKGMDYLLYWSIRQEGRHCLPSTYRSQQRWHQLRETGLARLACNRFTTSIAKSADEQNLEGAGRVDEGDG
jgi:hypothetical protein